MSDNYRKLIMLVDGDRLTYVGDGYGEEAEHMEEALEDVMPASSIISVDITDMSEEEFNKLKNDTMLLNNEYASLIVGE